MNKLLKLIFPYFLAVLIILIDQVSKALVRHSMAQGESLPVVQNVFHLTYIENSGVAFGAFSGHTGIFVFVSLLVLAGLVIFVCKEKSSSLLLHYGVAMVIAGAVGNIIDRVMKASVTDMFDFRIWPIFNVADIAVCVGFGLLVLYLFFDQGDKHVGSKNHDSE